MYKMTYRCSIAFRCWRRRLVFWSEGNIILCVQISISQANKTTFMKQDDIYKRI